MDAERDVTLVVAAGDAGGQVAGAVAAALDAALHRERAAPALGDDVDDAADRVRAVEAGLGAAQDLDALDVVGRQVGEVELAVGDELASMPSISTSVWLASRAANAHLRQAGEAAGAAHADAGQAAQRVGGVADLHVPQVARGDDRDRGADGLDRNAAGASLVRRPVAASVDQAGAGAGCGAGRGYSLPLGVRVRGAALRLGLRTGFGWRERRALHDDAGQLLRSLCRRGERPSPGVAQVDEHGRCWMSTVLDRDNRIWSPFSDW